ncbi:MAG TPA: peptidylprolyl isomerase [Symbiobacteriaceae bacterium]|nr:peptidylprolyl isomerase [Symbiobacteriaceae bacterium]
MANETNKAVVALAVGVTLLVAGAGGFFAGARYSQGNVPESKALATVNGEKITEKQVADQLIKQHGSDTISRMIDQKLVEQEAKKKNITVTQADVDAEIKKIKGQFQSEEAFQSALQQAGYTMADLESDQKFRLHLTKLLEPTLDTSDATLKKYFDENQAQFDKREVNSRHILVATEDEAKAIKAQLDTGADFATLAKAKSTDPSAATNGGEMGFNARGKMVPEYDNVVFAQAKGTISAPFQTQYGWHVAQTIDIKGDAPDFAKQKAAVKDAYTQSQLSAKAQEYLDSLKKDAKITNTLETKTAK